MILLDFLKHTLSNNKKEQLLLLLPVNHTSAQKGSAYNPFSLMNTWLFSFFLVFFSFFAYLRLVIWYTVLSTLFL